MAKANTKSFELRTDVECAQKVTLVRDCINRSKDAAAEAVAIAYLLERGCQSGFAKLWLLTEFETRNAEIEEHNKQLSELFTEANRYVNEKLSKEHWLNQTPVDAVEAASQQERRDELKRIASLESRDKNHMRMVRIEAREGASRFTRLVKYLYNFDRDHHASMVSRYCLALEWVAAKFDDRADAEIDDIKKAIAAHDGLERIVQLQREIDDNTEEAQGEREIINRVIRDESLARLANLAAVASLGIDPGNLKDDYGLFLYQKRAGKLEILGDANLPGSSIDRAVLNLAESLPIESDPLCEFIGRVVQVGATIRDNYEINSTTANGGKLTVRRCITVKPNEQGRSQLIVSPLHLDAGPVFKATPKTLEITALPGETLIMRHDNRRKLEREIISPANRSLLTLTMSAQPTQADGTPAESEMAWIVDNRALRDHPVTNYAPRSVFWRNLTAKKDKPLDVELFRPGFGGEIDVSDLGLIFDDVLKPWFEAKAAERSKLTVRVSVENGILTVSCGNKWSSRATLQNPQKSAGVVSLRPRDVFEVLLRLNNWKTRKFAIHGDLGGLLEIAWTDDFADYSYYLPTLNAEARYETRRLCKMEPAALPLAAE